MAKKSAKGSTSRNTDTSENPGSQPDWIATNLLDPRDSNCSTMKIEKLEEVKLLFHSNVVVVVPHSTILANWHKKDWVCFYYYPFDIGLTFLFSKLITEVLSVVNVSPGQLMPFA